MRSRPLNPLHLLSRLLMAVFLLVGTAISVSPGMAANGMEAHGIVAQMDAQQHPCCEPRAAEPGCVAGCSAVTCATPILPGHEAALLVSRDAAAALPVTRFLRSEGPELETPPPRA
ncbi:MAG TPA: hypothetical protein VLQ65_04400 [Saliniramus sp.]|nr:hypothetical protein [Saliniramus sp.]